jgi:hypothetical protein
MYRPLNFIISNSELPSFVTPTVFSLQGSEIESQKVLYCVKEIQNDYE